MRTDPSTDGADQTDGPIDLRTPDRAYDERWAAALLERVLARLRQEFTDSGRGELFNLFKEFLAGRVVDGSYAAVAAKVGMTEGAARATVARIRDRYRRLLRAEVMQMVIHVEDVDEELRELLAILRGD